MGFHAHRPVGRTLVSVALFGGLLAACVALGAPAYASSSSDLSVSLSNKAAAKPGHRVSYKVTVHNAGPSKAEKVRAEFVTTTSMTSVKYTISTGHCTRGPKETACLFGSLKPGQTETVTISGVIPKKLHKGAAVNNKVTLRSSTHLTNTKNDVATDNYRIGVPRTVAVPAPSPSSTQDSKIAKLSNAASATIRMTDKALIVSLVALAAAAAWFAIGLTLRHRSRRRKAALDAK